MKKIFYLVFFISLCFLVNVNFVNAAEGYCEYSLTNFSEGNKIEDLGEASIKFKIDTNKKNHVDIEWNINYKNQINNNKQYYITLSFKNIKYIVDFDENILYDKMIKGSEFSCPNLYGLLLNTGDLTSLTINTTSLVGDGSQIQLNLLKEQKPSNLEQEKLINQCGVGITAEKYGLPENMTVTFKKYTSRNEVCVKYFKGASFCKNYIAGNELNISTETGSITKSFIFEDKDLKKIFNNITANSAECIDLWVDSSQINEGVFRISTEKSNNGLDTEITTGGYEETVKIQQILDGTQFKNLLGSLRPPLETLSKEKLGDSFNVLALPLTIDGKSATLNDVTANDKLCSGNDCSSNALGYTEQGLKNVVQYCNILYEKYPSYKNEQNIQKRMDECSDFYQFYGELIANGIVEDFSQGCAIFSTKLKEKLVWILDIIKIAGPILALGLGTLDFVKVLANGDADKEMKTAFKRFMTRLGAAALLFIIPLILAFLLDVFLGNKDGYDPDNPFCVYIDWNE